MEKPNWFNIELIPDDYLPPEVFIAEGAFNRSRRSSVTWREMAGLEEKKLQDVTRVYPEQN